MVEDLVLVGLVEDLVGGALVDVLLEIGGAEAVHRLACGLEWHDCVGGPCTQSSGSSSSFGPAAIASFAAFIAVRVSRLNGPW